MRRYALAIAIAVVAAALGFAAARAHADNPALCAPYAEAWAKASRDADLNRMNVVLNSIPDDCAFKAQAEQRFDELEAQDQAAKAQADQAGASQDEALAPAAAAPAAEPQAADSPAAASQAEPSLTPQANDQAGHGFDDPMSSIPPSGER
jgi:hypothetical protein